MRPAPRLASHCRAAVRTESRQWPLATGRRPICVRCEYRTLLNIATSNPSLTPTSRPSRAFSSSLKHYSNPKSSSITNGPQPSSSTDSSPTHPLKNPPSTPSALQPRLDVLLTRVNHVTHRLNAYMGTDYTPIAQLRSLIPAAEAAVAASTTDLAAAKATHATALSTQSSAQKEVVRLLERKASWSPADLERYMVLIRSELRHEADVQTARETVDTAELALETTRAELERLERRRYHEEQVWSDTIRRNSTWVTIALMGVNVAVLVVGLIVVEPWRRRRLVKEILQETGARPFVPVVTVEDVDAGMEAGLAAEHGQGASGAEGLMLEELASTPPALVDVLNADASREQWDRPALQLLEISPTTSDSWAASWAAFQRSWHDLFSDKQVALRRVDVTKTALEGMAAGAAAMGLLLVLLRPR